MSNISNTPSCVEPIRTNANTNVGNNNNASQAIIDSADNVGAFNRCQQGERITEIRGLLGNNTVLLPVRHGEKRPIDGGWQDKTIAVMSDPAYLERLNIGNVGVLLGSASDGLCAIDIDSDDAVAPFLALNPTLRSTLRSKGARGQQIWVKVTGDYPKLSIIKTDNEEGWGEWRADGAQSIIAGVHPDGMDYQIVQRAQPVECEFEDINWPDGLHLPWVKTDFGVLVEKNGEPFTISSNGLLGLNHMFFVQKYALEHTVKYDAGLAVGGRSKCTSSGRNRRLQSAPLVGRRNSFI